MNFDELVDFLEKRLQSKLPGADAHNLMLPKMTNGAAIQMKHANPPKEGGVLVLLYEESGIVKFPLIQRPSYEGIHSGQMALPGGRMEEEDEDLIMTARRETREEIGVPEADIKVIGNLSPFYVGASNYNVLPVIGTLKSNPSFLADPREVEEIITPQLGDLVVPDRVKSKVITVRDGIDLQCPYFDLEGRTVWGATAMMLSELSFILREFHHQ